MPVIYNKKVEYAYTDPGVKAHTLSWAEYQALSEDDKMNGDLYFIPDKQPEGNPSRIWTKLGTDPLTTQADDVSGAVNELNSSLTIKSDTKTITTNGNGIASITSEFNLDMSKTILLGVFLEGTYKYENYYTRNVNTGVINYNIAVLNAGYSTYTRVANTSITVHIRYLELNQ